MNQEQIERTLKQAMTLLAEVSAALAQAQQPAPSVLQRIHGTARGFEPRIVRPPAEPVRERAYYYLHIAPADEPTKDAVWRVVGHAALSQAAALEAEALAAGKLVERLDSREVQAMFTARRRLIREGAVDVGTQTHQDIITK